MPNGTRWCWLRRFWPACNIEIVAGVIQLVECQLPKLDVAGSSPVARSREIFKLLSLSVAGLRVGPGDFLLGPTPGPTLGPTAVGPKGVGRRSARRMRCSKASDADWTSAESSVGVATGFAG